MRYRSDWIFTVFSWFIGFMFIAVIVSFVASGVLLLKGAKAVESKGLKAVIERVWFGEEQ